MRRTAVHPDPRERAREPTRRERAESRRAAASACTSGPPPARRGRARPKHRARGPGLPPPSSSRCRAQCPVVTPVTQRSARSRPAAPVVAPAAPPPRPPRVRAGGVEGVCRCSRRRRNLKCSRRRNLKCSRQKSKVLTAEEVLTAAEESKVLTAEEESTGRRTRRAEYAARRLYPQVRRPSLPALAAVPPAPGPRLAAVSARLLASRPPARRRQRAGERPSFTSRVPVPRRLRPSRRAQPQGAPNPAGEREE